MLTVQAKGIDARVLEGGLRGFQATGRALDRRPGPVGSGWRSKRGIPLNPPGSAGDERVTPRGALRATRAGTRRPAPPLASIGTPRNHAYPVNGGRDLFDGAHGQAARQPARPERRAVRADPLVPEDEAVALVVERHGVVAAHVVEGLGRLPSAADRYRCRRRPGPLW